MRAIVLATALASMAGAAQAAPLAICGAVKGSGYFVEKGLVGGPDVGWHPDQMSAGRITLNRNDKGEFDVTFSDATGGVYSSVAEGGTVLATRLGRDDAAIVVIYPGATTEIYHFVRDAKGKQKVLLLQSKGGGSITKGAVMVGECSYLKLD